MFKDNLAYEASAGSGKTFMLVVRYLSLLFKGSDANKIVALTFTNKAALEMQERIILTLEELENRGELDVISEVTELSKTQLLEMREPILKNFLNSNSKIMTIDKFFTQILRKFSLYASLMPDFSTFSSQHEQKLLSRFLKEVTVAGEKSTLISLSLDSKKRLLSIFNLLDEFYVKSSELENFKFEKALFYEYEKEAMKSLKEIKAIVDRCDKASQTVKNAVDAQSMDELLAKSWIGKDTLNYRTFSKCFTPEMDTHLLSINSSIKEFYIAKEQNFFYGLHQLTTTYKRAKKALHVEDGELSFNDVTSLVYHILNERVDSDFLYFRLDSQIEHILLDEFQDTSILQYKILKPLINEIVSGNAIFDSSSLFFVGDIKQSIYRFRGGVSALFKEVSRENATEVEQLLTNYRSQKEVIEFVNRTFIHRINNYSNQKTRDEADGGYVEIKDSDEVVDEVMEIVDRLIELGSPLDDIAILCATNGDGEVIKDTLISKNIEVVTQITTKLINQKSIKAILEYLKYQYFRQDIYRRNFFTLISQELKDLSFINFNHIKIVDVVKKVIDEFGLYSDDFHLIRFINLLSKYRDIESLLFEYERLDASASESDLSGVRVLTIHKSKGLEFENVIVMDRLKKAPSSRNSIIFEYDGIELSSIYLRSKSRESIDERYKNAIDKEKILADEDLLNALYVAFTRAKSSLFIVQKHKVSSFELLGLKSESFGELNIVENCAIEVNNNSSTCREFKDLYYGTQSDILAMESEKEEDIKAINFGLAMHYMLEMMSSFTKQSIPQATNMMLNRYGNILDESEIEDITNRVVMLLESSEFMELVDGVCFKERAMRYRKKLRYIDLLVLQDESYNIIDYKSSIAFSSHHIAQVKEYEKAVNEITKKPTKGYICYMLKDKIMIESL